MPPAKEMRAGATLHAILTPTGHRRLSSSAEDDGIARHDRDIFHATLHFLRVIIYFPEIFIAIQLLLFSSSIFMRKPYFEFLPSFPSRHTIGHIFELIRIYSIRILIFDEKSSQKANFIDLAFCRYRYQTYSIDYCRGTSQNVKTPTASSHFFDKALIR